MAVEAGSVGAPTAGRLRGHGRVAGPLAALMYEVRHKQLIRWFQPARGPKTGSPGWPACPVKGIFVQ